MKNTLLKVLGPLRTPLRRAKQRAVNARRVRRWHEVLANTPELQRFAGNDSGPRVIHMAMLGHMFLTNFEVPFALALNGRGARVEMVYDDATFPLCELTTEDVVAEGKGLFCDRCVCNMHQMTDPSPLTVRTTGAFCDADTLARFRETADAVDLAEVVHYAPDDIPIGKAAFMVTLRFFRKGALDATPEEQDVLRKYLVSAMITRHVAERLAEEGPIHAAMMSHGIYCAWEPALAVFRKRGITCVCYDRVPGPAQYQFNMNATAQNGDISGAWNDRWKGRTMTSRQRDEALDYLASRETFEREPVKYSETPPRDPKDLRAELGIPADKTALLLVSNLVWDAAAVGRDLIFKDTLDWVCTTIDCVAWKPDALHLIVKPHPAESMRGTKLFVADEVHQRYPELPPNVTVMTSDVKINPMSLMKAVEVGIAHTSTAGMEMSSLGKPVICVSQANYRDKGFTFDPETLEQYRELIAHADELTGRYTPEMQQLALKYLYVRFFMYRHSVPITEEKGFMDTVGYNLRSLDDLLPGNFEHLDYLCDAILGHRADFVRD